MIETAEMGALFKKIRLSRQLSLKDVAGDFLSVSFLSKFERGESEISLSRFFLLLDNLDVSIEEFYGILAKEHATTTEILLDKVSKAYYQKNLLALEKYLAEEQQKYDETNKKIFLYNVIMIESFLIDIKGGKIATEQIESITDYLFGIEQWGKRELIILGNSMSAIATETLNLLIKEIVYKVVLFGSSETNFRIRIHLLLNAVAEFTDRNQLALAQTYLEQLETIGIPENFLYERLEYQMAKGTLLIKSGKKEQGSKKIRQALTVLNYLDAENLLLSKENDYKKLLDSTL